MIQLTAAGRYRGPGGVDPKKTRAVRERELQRMAGTQDGAEIVFYLWLEAKGVPAGSEPEGARGTLLKQEMIPEVLAHEYPSE
jgi:hypothetical protein